MESCCSKGAPLTNHKEPNVGSRYLGPAMAQKSRGDVGLPRHNRACAGRLKSVQDIVPLRARHEHVLLVGLGRPDLEAFRVVHLGDNPVMSCPSPEGEELPANGTDLGTFGDPGSFDRLSDGPLVMRLLPSSELLNHVEGVSRRSPCDQRGRDRNAGQQPPADSLQRSRVSRYSSRKERQQREDQEGRDISGTHGDQQVHPDRGAAGRNRNWTARKRLRS